MTEARSTLVDIASTSYYHCMARCVRRAFLCGEDHLTGNNYEHRKAWVIERLRELSSVFAIEICAYAVMSNHYHVVLHINAEQGTRWKDQEVLMRWQQLFSAPLLVQKYLTGYLLPKAELQKVKEYASLFRQRLQDISWLTSFMRCLNEHLARRANKEDQCKGRFWEGRFKSQALLDEAAVLSCMAYVDLNPVRAGVASLPEESDFTSIQARILQYKKKSKVSKSSQQLTVPLKPLRSQGVKTKEAISFLLTNYFQLIDWTGRIIREGKQGYIDGTVPDILKRLQVNPHAWLKFMQPEGNRFRRVAGRLLSIKKYGEILGKQWLHGVAMSQQLFS